MRVLITGGAGFIGSHLSDHLLQQGHEVTIVDDLSTGRMENFAHLKAMPHFNFAIETIMNEAVTPIPSRLTILNASRTCSVVIPLRIRRSTSSSPDSTPR